MEVETKIELHAARYQSDARSGRFRADIGAGVAIGNGWPVFVCRCAACAPAVLEYRVENRPPACVLQVIAIAIATCDCARINANCFFRNGTGDEGIQPLRSQMDLLLDTRWRKQPARCHRRSSKKFRGAGGRYDANSGFSGVQFLRGRFGRLGTAGFVSSRCEDGCAAAMLGAPQRHLLLFFNLEISN